MVYKTVGDTQLHLHIFRPTKQRTKAPAVVFFFGGGWRSGTPAQFEQQCRYLASRGMVAMTAEYRIRNMHGTLATACVADGKSAVRWIRANAGKLAWIRTASRRVAVQQEVMWPHARESSTVLSLRTKMIR